MHTLGASWADSYHHKDVDMPHKMLYNLREVNNILGNVVPDMLLCLSHGP